MTTSPRKANFKVLIASLIGTTIEFFDFYIYATAAVLVFPHLFFPKGSASAQSLQSLATFALAFFARPLGSLFFGHFGDRLGRKVMLVSALLTMGLSTVAIGLLPSYQTIGIYATFLLCLFRFGQGVGLGGEWGGAVLLATENAPPGKKAWFGMFPQMGAPLGFILSTGTFLILTNSLTEKEFLTWGWRIPFVASLLLVGVGLFVRLSLEETKDFKQLEKAQRVSLPMGEVLMKYPGTLILGSLTALATFVLFYLMTVFSLSWGVTHLGYSRQEFLIFQILAAVVLAMTIPLSALFADRLGRRWVLMGAALLVILFGTSFSALLVSQSPMLVTLFLALGLGVMGFTYGPLGTALAEAYPTNIRYTGASLSFNLAGILGASLTPAIASSLANQHGVWAVGLYLAGAGVITFFAAWLLLKKSNL